MKSNTPSDLFCAILLVPTVIIIVGFALLTISAEMNITPEPDPYIVDNPRYVTCDYGEGQILRIPTTLSVRKEDVIIIKHHHLSFEIQDNNGNCILPE